MKEYEKTGYDIGGEYGYNDIKSFKMCCSCKFFYDNEKETRFECSRKNRPQDCHIDKYED